MTSKADVETIHLLSPAQQGVLFHSLQAPKSNAYFGQQVYQLEGTLDSDSFQRAWQRTVDRHAALRSAFVWDGTERMLQVVFRRASAPWNFQDWKTIPASRRREQLDKFLEEDRRWGFNLSEAPLLRLALIRMEENSYYFVVSQHHLLLDGWSFG